MVATAVASKAAATRAKAKANTEVAGAIATGVGSDDESGEENLQEDDKEMQEVEVDEKNAQEFRRLQHGGGPQPSVIQAYENDMKTYNQEYETDVTGWVRMWFLAPTNVRKVLKQYSKSSTVVQKL